jgi:hypothetical protein
MLFLQLSITTCFFTIFESQCMRCFGRRDYISLHIKFVFINEKGSLCGELHQSVCQLIILINYIYMLKQINYTDFKILGWLATLELSFFHRIMNYIRLDMLTNLLP